MQVKLILFLLAAGIFAAALLTGPPSFDSTDGAEFAVCGSKMQIAHAPGYPLFLMALRALSLVLSPLYGHLRLINCFIGALLIPLAAKAFRVSGASLCASVYASVLFSSAAPVMSQLNSLEVYPMAMALTLAAVAFRKTTVAPYAAGSAVFAGHPVSILCAPVMTGSRSWKSPLALTALIPLTLLLYIPLRAASASIAHYGHPTSFLQIWEYLTMYSGRLSVPSLFRLTDALSYIGTASGAVFLLLASAGGRLRLRQDLPILLALLFLACYELPDPAGQLWVLLVPLSLRCAMGMDRLVKVAGSHWLLIIPVALSSGFGVISAGRRTDDVAMRWTVDVMSQLPRGAIYRPAAHDTYYAAYATEILGVRKDVVLSDPFGNYFELMIPPPVPPMIGNRTVHVSRAWDRTDDFRLSGLIFHPVQAEMTLPQWESMEIFSFTGTSPDPMALDIVAEAWARRMVQTEDPLLKDSFCNTAAGFAATEITRRRVENLRNF